MTRPLARRRGAAAGAALALLLATGCSSGSDGGDDGAATTGGGSAPTSSSGAASEATSEEQQALMFSRCMRENGVPSFPDPVVASDGSISFGVGSDGLEGVDTDVLNAANTACEQYSDGLGGSFDASNQSDLQDSLVAYAQCMRQNGYDLADPDFSAGSGPGALSEFAAGIDRSDPAFTAANAVCESELAGLGAPG